MEKRNPRARMSTRPPSVVAAVLLLCLFFSCDAVKASEVRSTAYRDLTRLGARGSNVSLKKGNILSQFWNEKVLGRVYDDLKVVASVSAKEGLQNFTRAGTVASYLQLSFVDAIYLPVPINFIFVGFDGDGNQGFKLGEEELERWFQNIDHILEHTRVPQLGDEMTPFYRVKGSGESQTHLPLISYTHYNYSVHGIALNTRTTAVFERAIKLLSRKDTEDDDVSGSGDSEWQVDIGGMSHIFRSLVNYLQLENAYNIFVLNPKRDPSHGSYGYRSGLSATEITFLRDSPGGTAALLKSKTKAVDFLAALDTVKRPLYDRHPLLRFSWTTTEDDHTETWVESMQNALNSVEAATRLKSDEEMISWTALQILNGKDMQMASALRKSLSPKGDVRVQSECLVDAWVGQERWAFVDLSAGPFTWGPAVGGDGVRTEQSVPSVDSSFKSVTMPDTEVDEVAVNEDFQNIWRARFVYLGEDQQHTVDLLLAEIDVYEMFAHKHCSGRKIALNFCVEFQKRVESVKEELQKIHREDASDNENAELLSAQKTKASELLKRLDEGNIFGFVHERTGNFSVARDSFLAHLGSVFASSMRHVVTPSTADNAFHYYETVAFELYFITQDKVKDDRLLPVDTDAIKAALSRLVVPSQKSTFGIHTLVLSEDPALAMAFTSAKRVSIVPMLLVNGTYKSADRIYLDSRILRHHIKQLDLPVSERKPKGRFTLQIPIFWFFRSSGMPLLVDKHHQAKSMSDMVIVVQSPQSTWESHLHCNGDSIRWDLRQPTKAAVAAVAEHMAGLLPSHLTFSSAHDNSIQNWLWSVGSHPFSSTSSGWTVSAFQTDAMARNYIVTALDESVEVLNAGVRLLSSERTQRAAFSTFRSREQTLRFSFNRVISTWKQIARFSEELRYGEALTTLHHLESHAQSFYSNANDTRAALHPVYCTRQGKWETRTDIWIGLSLPFVVVFLCLMFRPKRGKAKSN